MNRARATMKPSPKAMAQILTREGFIRWTEGKPLRNEDFKPIDRR